MSNSRIPVDPDMAEINFRCLKAVQPIGDLYVATINYNLITKISSFDVRRLVKDERDVETYLGVQRPVSSKRVDDLKEYVNHFDASFPTSIILAIEDGYADYDSDDCRMTIRNFKLGENSPSIALGNVARVLDGQHRIAGLYGFNGFQFDLTVTIFVGADIADQAQIFATVNLEQTKVSKSLAYDLYELSRSRSPQKTCHNIAVALDRDKKSPFFRRIKRLGLATEGRTFEPITQATFVEALIGYISLFPKRDRDLILRGSKLDRLSSDDLNKVPLRALFIGEEDLKITQIIYNYFVAVRNRWPDAWDNRGRGYVLNRTNGFRALMRAFGTVYLNYGGPGQLVQPYVFQKWFDKIQINDDDFNVDFFPPGTSGEARLYRVLVRQEEIMKT